MCARPSGYIFEGVGGWMVEGGVAGKCVMVVPFENHVLLTLCLLLLEYMTEIIWSKNYKIYYLPVLSFRCFNRYLEFVLLY